MKLQAQKLRAFVVETLFCLFVGLVMEASLIMLIAFAIHHKKPDHSVVSVATQLLSIMWLPIIVILNCIASPICGVYRASYFLKKRVTSRASRAAEWVESKFRSVTNRSTSGP